MMFKGLYLLAALAASSLLLSAPAQARVSDEVGVREALGHYLAGHATGDPAEFRKAMHDDFKMYVPREGKLIQRTDEEYIAGATGKPAADEAQRKRRIELVSVTGDVAVAKLILDYPGVLFTDYMALVKTADGWKIITKLVDAKQQPKP